MKIKLTGTKTLKLALVAAGLALAATIVVGTERENKEGPAEPVVRVRAGGEQPPNAHTPATKPAATDLDLARLNRFATTEIEDDLFAPRIPLVVAPPPPPAVQAPPPKPTAPALLFRFLGRMVDGGTRIVFVTDGGRNLSLKQGDVVDNLYRLEEVSDASVTFVYLPLEERQTLQIGRTN